MSSWRRAAATGFFLFCAGSGVGVGFDSEGCCEELGVGG